MTKPTLRRVMQSIGFLVPAVAAAVMGYLTEDWVTCVAVMTFGLGFRGAVYSSQPQTPLDISPNYSGTVYGFVNGFGCLAGFLTPLVANVLTGHDPTNPTGWQNLFWTASGLYIVSTMSYIVIAKFVPQKFDKM